MPFLALNLEQLSLELQHIVLTDHALFLKAENALQRPVAQQRHMGVLGVDRWLGELPVHLFQENLRYDKVGEGLGARGEYVTAAADFRPALERSYAAAASEGLSTVINCQAIKEFWSSQDYPPGFLQKVEPGCMGYYH